jgi:hypothetical protein
MRNSGKITSVIWVFRMLHISTLSLCMMVELDMQFYNTCLHYKNANKHNNTVIVPFDTLPMYSFT